MRAGKLDRRVTILRRQQTGTDALGAPIFTYGEVATVWAQRTDRTADEAFSAEQRFARKQVTFRTRFIELLPTDKLLSEGVTYDVKGSIEIGRRAGIDIFAEAQS